MTVSVAQFQLYFLALTRILAILIHVPVLGGRMVPNPVKIGLGLLLAVVLIPWQPLPQEAESLPALAFGFSILREMIVGTLAGFASVLTFSALTIAGHMMSQASGFNAGQMLNPAFEESGSSMDQIFLTTSFLFFLVINGHHDFLRGLQQTFTLLPPNSPLPALQVETLLRMTASLILAGVQLSLPVVGSLLLADLTLGVIARVAPQVHVFFLGVPLKIGLGLLVMALSTGYLLPRLVSLFRMLGPRTLELLGG
jgi:flagellar biosynthetic protein FliR